MINDFRINQVDNNQQNLQNNSESCLKKILKHTTMCYSLFTTITIILFLSTLIFNIKIFNFTLCEWPVIYKHQYYRLLTHNFFHLNFVHIASNLIFFYVIGISLEKKLGTALMMTIILQTSLLISIVYLIQIVTLNYFVVTLMNLAEYNYDFYCSAGFSGILFTLLYINYNFSKIANGYVLMFGIIPIKAKIVPIAYLLLIQILIPNSSTIGHLSGIITGFLIKNVLVYLIIPRKDWIKDSEIRFKGLIDFLKINLYYVEIESISSENLEDLNEFDKEFKDIICVRCIYNLWRRARSRGSHINEQVNEGNNYNL
jgi:membrane associated rhomboid family serine protease